MADRKHPPLTPEQKATKAARERERYHRAREAGLTPKEARSIRKAAQEKPGILDKLRKAVKDTATPKRPTRKTGSGGGGRRSTPKTPPPLPGFDEFVRQNPGKAGNELIREYRQRGGKIGNERGKRVIRDVQNKKRDPKKVTRFRYHSPDDKPLFGEADKRLIKDRYMYLVEFEVEQEDAADTKTDWLYVASDRELTMREIREYTLDIWADGYLDGREKYKAVRIIPESIVLIHAVDTWK